MTAPADSLDIPFPAQGALLGVDYGTRRFGFAVCNREQTIASPLEVYTRKRAELDAEHVRRVIRDYNVVGLVVGLPLHMSGDEGGKAREARACGTWLSRATSLPVCYADERFSTQQAELRLHAQGIPISRQRGMLDKLAAQTILQNYLDLRARDERGP